MPMPTFRTSSSGSLSRTCSCSSRSSTSSLSTLPALSALNGSPVPKQPVARPQACNIIFIFLLVALAALSFSLGTTGRARTALLYLNQRYIIHRAPFYLTATLSRREQSKESSTLQGRHSSEDEQGRVIDERPEMMCHRHAETSWWMFCAPTQPNWSGDVHVHTYSFIEVVGDRAMNFGQTTPSYKSGKYSLRREAIRDTFLPELQALPGAAVKFVVGKSRNPLVAAAMALEERRHPGTFMHVDAVECYRCLPQKTLAFFLAAAQEYNVKWIVKLDDDVYVKPPRLEVAASQWEKIGAEYVGCMKHGKVHTESSHRWYEPAWRLLPQDAHMNAYGSLYALSGRAVDLAVTRNGGNLRQLGNEDTSIGLWMAAFNVTFFEDMRLCMPHCHLNTVAVLKNECSGLCNPPKDMRRMHRRRNCQRALELFKNGTFPFAPSLPGHNFDHMHAI